MHNKLVRHSIFFRMMTIFFIAILPVYAIGYSIYRNGSEQLVREILTTRTGQMEHYMRSIENDIQQLIQTQSQCVSDTNINIIANRYYDLSNYEWGRYINTHIRELQSLHNMSPYTYSVTTYYPALGKKINNVSGLSDFTTFDESVCRAANESRTNLFWLYDQLYTASSLRPSGRDAAYSIVSMLSKRQVRLDLTQFEGLPGTMAALVFSSGHVMAETQPEFGVRAESIIAPTVEPQTSSQIVSGHVWGEMGERYAFCYTHSPSLNLWLYMAVSDRELNAANSGFAKNLWFFFTAATLVVVVFSLLLRQGVLRPLRKLLHAFERLEAGDMSVHIQSKNKDEFGYLYDQFNQMVKNLEAYIDEAYAQKMMLQRSELIQLQSQINPHFLYNSYFLLHRMIRGGDMDNAQIFSKHMGEYFRYITRTARQSVPLIEEVSHARTYADIQALRFEGRIDVSFMELPEAYRQIIVPRLILQPILENAFEHGLKEKAEEGLVVVRFHARTHGLTIIIEDNGDDLSDEKIAELNARPHGEITALINIHARLSSVLGIGSGLVFSRCAHGGLKAEVILEGLVLDEPIDCG